VLGQQASQTLHHPLQEWQRVAKKAHDGMQFIYWLKPVVFLQVSINALVKVEESMKKYPQATWMPT
jgi:hypothetical protein